MLGPKLLENSNAVIKDINGYKINLTEEYTIKYPWLVVMILLGIIIIPCILYEPSQFNPTIIWFGIGGIIILGTAVISTQLSPAYKLYTHCGTKTIIKYVIKTTPEEDQRNICKTVKEIESEISDVITGNQKLQIIADKCK